MQKHTLRPGSRRRPGVIQTKTYTVTVGETPVEVTEKRMKTLRLRVLPDLSVRLSVPIGTTRKRIARFLEEREEWIRAALAEMRSRPGGADRDLESGDAIDLWGVRYRLTVTEGGTRYSLSLSEEAHVAHLCVPSGSTPEKRERYLRDVRRKELEHYLSDALPRAEALTGLHAASHDIRHMTSRWGSCNTRTGHVRLNLRLAEHPRICTDYVLLHELCHLKHADHGPAFKALLASFMPEWKDVRRLLNG